MGIFTSLTAAVVVLFSQFVSALPPIIKSGLQARQDLDFNLVGSTPIPHILPEDIMVYNATAAILEAIEYINTHPLPLRHPALQARTVRSTAPGYSTSVLIDTHIIDAPLDCNQQVSTFAQVNGKSAANSIS
jgi:hypothetical protein